MIHKCGRFNVHNSHLLARDNSHAIRERMKSASASVFGLEIVGEIVGLYLLLDRLTAQRYRDFLEAVLPGLLEEAPVALRQSLWFQPDRVPAR
jgi:hypothetical protein